MSASPASRLQLLGSAVLFSTGGAAIKLCALTGWQVVSFRAAIAALTLLVLRAAAGTGPRSWWAPSTPRLRSSS